MSAERSLSISLAGRKTILAVDDEAINLEVLAQSLNRDYRVLVAKDGERALAVARSQRPDLVLMDIMMPGMSGHEAVSRLQADPVTAEIPVIFVTALADRERQLAGLKQQAFDYIIKPIDPDVLRERVRACLTHVHIDQLEASRLQVIRCLGHAAEFRDYETGQHIIRMSHYSRLLAEASGLGAEDCEFVLNAAPMHDVGKIGIPDRVLLKPGRFDEEEWAVMKTHARIGHDILAGGDSPLLRLAASIALHHHERWDGTGYPQGLAGEAIPLEGRIVAIADVFDALTSRRPYKQPWLVEEAVAHLKAGAGAHFDPALVPLFLDRLEDIEAIRARWPDPAVAG